MIPELLRFVRWCVFVGVRARAAFDLASGRVERCIEAIEAQGCTVSVTAALDVDGVDITLEWPEH